MRAKILELPETAQQLLARAGLLRRLGAREPAAEAYARALAFAANAAERAFLERRPALISRVEA